MRYRFAEAVRAEVEPAQTATAALRLRRHAHRPATTALSDPLRGPAACARLRDRYAVVLVDEFQDTDPVQWNILRTAFHGHATLVLIGDPKQAIYAFRGADVVSYLSAADAAAGARHPGRELAQRRAADSPPWTPCSTAPRSATTGSPSGRSTAAHTESAPDRDAGRRPASGAGASAAHGLRLNAGGLLAIDDARAGGGRRRGPRHRGAPRQRRTPRRPAPDPGRCGGTGAHPPAEHPGARSPRRHRHTGRTTGASSVFGTPAARDWLTLLEALEQPHRATRVAAAALTSFVGWSAATLAAASHDELDALGTTLRRWAAVLSDRGVAALLEAVTVDRATGAAAGPALRRTAPHRPAPHRTRPCTPPRSTGQLGLAAIVEWLRHHIDEAPDDISPNAAAGSSPTPTRCRSSPSTAAKDWSSRSSMCRSAGTARRSSPTCCHLHDAAGSRVLDVGGRSGAGFADRSRQHQAEDADEDLRLLYVALTRAQCQLVTWWAPTANTAHRRCTGYCSADPRPAPPRTPTYPVPDDATALAQLRQLASPDLAVEPEVAEPAAPTALDPPHRARADAGCGTIRPTPGHRVAAHLVLAADRPAVATTLPASAASRNDTDTTTRSMPAIVDTTDPVRRPGAGLADGRPARRGRLRHAGPRRARNRRHHRSGPAGRTHRPGPRTTRPPTAPPRPGRAWQPRCSRLSGPRSGPWPATAGSATSRPGTGSPNWTSSSPSTAATTAPASSMITLAAMGSLIGRHLDRHDPLAAYPARAADPLLGPQRLRGYLAGSIDAVLECRARAGHGTCCWTTRRTASAKPAPHP